MCVKNKPCNRPRPLAWPRSSRAWWCCPPRRSRTCTSPPPTGPWTPASVSGQSTGLGLAPWTLTRILKKWISHPYDFSYISGRETTTWINILPASAKVFFHPTVQDCTLSLIYLFWLFQSYILVVFQCCIPFSVKIS